MKKKNTMIILIILIGILATYLKTSTKIRDEKKDEKGSLIVMHINKNIVDSDKYIRCENLMRYGEKMEDYINPTEEIVYGEIKNINYYVYDGMQWSELKVRFIKKFKGKKKKDDTISVFIIGGYITTKQLFEEYRIKVKNVSSDEFVSFNQPKIGKHTIGERALFFLQRSSIFSYDQDCYELTNGEYSEYRCRGNEYCVKSNDEIEYNAKEIVENKLLTLLKKKGD